MAVVGAVIASRVVAPMNSYFVLISTATDERQQSNTADLWDAAAANASEHFFHSNEGCSFPCPAIRVGIVSTRDSAAKVTCGGTY